MSSLPKTGFARKTGTVILGVTLLSSLMLTACAPASQTNSSAPNPTTAATATTEAANGVQKFKTDAFDLSKQVSLDVKRDKSSILLGSGVVTQGKDGDKVTATYTPYETTDGKWKYTSDVAFAPNSNNYVKLMRWKDKNYIVVVGTAETSTEASGLTAATKTQTQYVTVLDATNGKVINVFKNDPVKTPFDSDISVTGEAQIDVKAPFMTGIVYSTSPTPTLVDPLTGQKLATTDTNSFNNEVGFYADRDFFTAVGGEYEKTTIKGVFGNFALVATAQPEAQTKNGYVQNSKFSLVNTVNKQIVSEISCANANYDIATSYSPDFRYVTFLGNFVFDTKTGKSFCTSPMNNLDVRKVTVTSVDNDGNVYGTVDRDYLRISLADNAKVETLGDFNSANEVPILITDKGSAVFRSDNEEDVLVVAPAKELNKTD